MNRLAPPAGSRRLFLLAAAGALFALGTAPSAHAQTAAYSIVDLGALTGTVSSANGINNAGQVVGYSGSGATGDPEHAALWTVQSNGSVVGKDLSNAGDGLSSASGINDAGLIGGYETVGPGYHAATFSVGSDGTVTRTDLGTFGAQDFHEAFGYGINAAGQVAGSSYVKSGTPYHAFLFALSNGVPVDTDLGTLGGDNSTGFAINDAGLIVGSSQMIPSSVAGAHAFFATLWTPNGDGTFTASELGTNTGLTSSAAYGLNNAGQVVGCASTTGTNNYAALFTLNGSAPATVKILGTLGTYCFADAINDAGQIVGNFTVSGGGGVTHGFVYTAAAGMQDINNLVGYNASATAISIIAKQGRALNRYGQIAASGTVGGKQHALLLNPTAPPVLVSGSSQETFLSAGRSYSQTPIFTDSASGSHNTQFGFVDGVAGSGGSTGTYGANRDVTAAFVANPGTTPLASDAATLTGTANDIVAVQMSFAPGFADAYFGPETNGCLGWFNGARWANAVDGNTGGAAVFAGNRAYNAATDFHLGTYGIDTVHDVAWAVVNHGGTFGVTINPDVLRRVKSASRSGTVSSVVVDGFTGHVYQLQRASTLTGGATDFVNVESAQNGSTGQALYFTHDDGAAPQGFYRVRVDP